MKIIKTTHVPLHVKNGHKWKNTTGKQSNILFQSFHDTKFDVIMNK